MALTVREFVKKSLREFYKRLKQYLSDLYATKQEIEDNSLATSAALNGLNDRLVDVEEGDWVTTEEYSEIESVVRDTYTKQEIDVMLDNVDVDLTEYYTKSQADSKFATTSQIPTQTSQLTNNSGFITSESDPVFSASPAANITSSDITNWNNKTSNTGTVTQVKVGSTAYNSSNGVVSLPAYPTTLPASDVSSWAKASTKPTYTASEVGAATQSDINTAIQNLIGTAPAALDTLGEIADALNDDANLAATLTNQIAAKYTKPSTGIPKSDLASTVQASLDRADTALQSYTETDPVFSASAAAGITTNDIDAWDAKQDAISDLATIRSNAAAGAAKISNVQADWNASSGLAQILNKPTIPTTLDQIADGSTRKLSNYLPLAGGTLTGNLNVGLVNTDHVTVCSEDVTITNSDGYKRIYGLESLSWYDPDEDTTIYLSLPRQDGTLALTSDIPTVESLTTAEIDTIWNNAS